VVLYLLLIGMTYTAIKHPTAVSEIFDKQLDRLADMSIKGVQNFEKISSQTQQRFRNNTNVSQYEAFNWVDQFAEHDRFLNEQRQEMSDLQNEETTDLRKTEKMFADDNDLLSNSLLESGRVNQETGNPLSNQSDNSFDKNRRATILPNHSYETSANPSAFVDRQRSPQSVAAEIPGLLAGLSSSPISLPTIDPLVNPTVNPSTNPVMNPPTTLQPSTWYFPPIAPTNEFVSH
jgi:hypothetical protein